MFQGLGAAYMTTAGVTGRAGASKGCRQGDPLLGHAVLCGHLHLRLVLHAQCDSEAAWLQGGSQQLAKDSIRRAQERQKTADVSESRPSGAG